MKLRIGDEILVEKGKDKGRRGKVERVFPSNDRVLVAGVNIYKKHQKPVYGKSGGEIEITRPLPIGSVTLVCPHCGKSTRVGFEILKDGTKVRICKKCERKIDENKGKGASKA